MRKKLVTYKGTPFKKKKRADFSAETIYRPEWHGTLSKC